MRKSKDKPYSSKLTEYGTAIVSKTLYNSCKANDDFIEQELIKELQSPSKEEAQINIYTKIIMFIVLKILRLSYENIIGYFKVARQVITKYKKKEK